MYLTTYEYDHIFKERLRMASTTLPSMKDAGSEIQEQRTIVRTASAKAKRVLFDIAKTPP